MKASKLQYIFKFADFLKLEDRYYIYSDYSIYDVKKSKEIECNSIEELLLYKLDNETISEKLDKIKIIFDYSGGRGASSGSKEMGGGFGSSNDKSGARNTKDLPPAYFNRQGRFSTPERAFQMFEEKYANAKVEYALSVDKDGFVHTHRKGGKSSVSINAKAKEHQIIHNHPNASNFSKADLLSTAQDRNAVGVIATGVKNNKLHRYTMTKNKNFNSKEFSKAVEKAKWPKKLSYDEGASWWLKKNQKKYGYKYTETHTTTKSKGGALKNQISLF